MRTAEEKSRDKFHSAIEEIKPNLTLLASKGIKGALLGESLDGHKIALAIPSNKEVKYAHVLYAGKDDEDGVGFEYEDDAEIESNEEEVNNNERVGLLVTKELDEMKENFHAKRFDNLVKIEKQRLPSMNLDELTAFNTLLESLSHQVASQMENLHGEEDGGVDGDTK